MLMTQTVQLLVHKEAHAQQRERTIAQLSVGLLASVLAAP
jgi:hypothetical protein